VRSIDSRAQRSTDGSTIAGMEVGTSTSCTKRPSDGVSETDAMQYRPAATYTGHEVAAPLAEKHLDHRGLAQPLIDALVCSEVLVPLDPPHDLDVRYIPVPGLVSSTAILSHGKRSFGPWHSGWTRTIEACGSLSANASARPEPSDQPPQQ
jgi:hypothetical protein